MTPFQQMQTWFRRASIAQRSLTSIASLVMFALLAWLVIPSGDPATTATGGFGSGSGSGQAFPEGAPAEGATDGAAAVPGAAGANPGDPAVPGAAAPGTNGAVGVPGAPGGPSGSGPGTTGSAGAPGTPGTSGSTGTGTTPGRTTTGKRCPSGSDQGVTEKQVRAAITIINIAGATGNSTIGVPTPALQEKYWRIVIDAENASGGFGCRKLVPEFYTVNPIDPNDTQQKCLQIARSKPFLAIDTGSLTQVGASDCIPQQKVPMIAHFLSTDQLKTYYPYYLSLRGVPTDTLRNGALAFRQLGQFTGAKGFKKLGHLFRTCRPSLVDTKRAALKEAGVAEGDIVSYSLGCPPGQQNTPADLQQAVLTFKNAGVTHVNETDVNDIANFTQSAAQQNFDPQYLLANDATTGVTGPDTPQQPDAATFDGAINVAALRYGENFTPGFKPTPGTARCNQIFAAKNEPPVYKQQVGYGGVICALMTYTKGLLDNTPQLKREALVQGMRALGTVDYSYPEGPVDYAAVPAGTPFGKPKWRSITYLKGCKCFQVTDPTFKASFR